MSKTLKETILEKLNQNDDLRYYFFKNVHLELVKKRDSMKKSNIKVILDLLLGLDPARKDGVQTLNDANYQGNPSFMKYSTYKKSFSDCWMSFLGLEMDQSIYSSVLDILHSKVIPNLADPTALMDFLVDAYNSGTYQIGKSYTN